MSPEDVLSLIAIEKGIKQELIWFYSPLLLLSLGHIMIKPNFAVFLQSNQCHYVSLPISINTSLALWKLRHNTKIHPPHPDSSMCLYQIIMVYVLLSFIHIYNQQSKFIRSSQHNDSAYSNSKCFLFLFIRIIPIYTPMLKIAVYCYVYSNFKHSWINVDASLRC